MRGIALFRTDRSGYHVGIAMRVFFFASDKAKRHTQNCNKQEKFLFHHKILPFRMILLYYNISSTDCKVIFWDFFLPLHLDKRQKAAYSKPLFIVFLFYLPEKTLIAALTSSFIACIAAYSTSCKYPVFPLSITCFAAV